MTGSIRRTGHDYVAGQQCGEAGDCGDLLRDAVNQVCGSTGCHRHVLAVQRERNLGVLPIQVIAHHDPRAERAGGIESLGSRPCGIDALQVAQRHVVHAGEAEHVIHCVLNGYVLGNTTHHHGHFRLEVHVLGAGRVHDRIIGANHRGGRLGENHHVLRRMGDFRMAGLVHELGVRLIVLGQTVDLGRNHWRKQADAIAINRVTITGRSDLVAGQRMTVQLDEVVLAVRFVPLHEGVARRIIQRKTCESHDSKTTPSPRPATTIPPTAGQCHAAGISSPIHSLMETAGE